MQFDAQSSPQQGRHHTGQARQGCQWIKLSGQPQVQVDPDPRQSTLNRLESHLWLGRNLDHWALSVSFGATRWNMAHPTLKPESCPWGLFVWYSMWDTQSSPGGIFRLLVLI